MWILPFHNIEMMLVFHYKFIFVDTKTIKIVENARHEERIVGI